MKLRDISQPLSAATAVWPGDQPVELAWTMRRERGDSVNVAAVTFSVHAGTHADGPLHVTDDGAGAGTLPLEAYIGPALVVDARGHERLDERALDGVPLEGVERLLFRTRERGDAAVFPERIAALSPALARRLAAGGLRLLGTDAPSVDPLDAKELTAHRVLAEAGVVHLENLVLDDVPPGRYTLVALPLRLLEADSAPVRAVLIEGETL
ncbi:MAG TPA: cyclase family protein [Longimicrobiales bacterium]|nr:cyclase family protein [Longimicrobiales bacterium]